MKKMKFLFAVPVLALLVGIGYFSSLSAAKPALASDNVTLSSAAVNADLASYRMPLYRKYCNPPCSGGWRAPNDCNSTPTMYLCNTGGTLQSCYGCPE